MNELELLEHRINRRIELELRATRDEIISLKRAIRDQAIQLTQLRKQQSSPLRPEHPQADLAPQMERFLRDLPYGRYSVDDLLEMFAEHTPASRGMSKIAFGKLSGLPKVRMRDPKDPYRLKINMYIHSAD